MYNKLELNAYRLGIKKMDKMRSEIGEILGPAIGRIRKIAEATYMTKVVQLAKFEAGGSKFVIEYRPQDKREPVQVWLEAGPRTFEIKDLHSIPLPLIPEVWTKVGDILAQFSKAVPELEAEIAFVMQWGMPAAKKELQK
jgi:hypothetical protein